MDQNGYRWFNCPENMYLGSYKTFFSGKNRLILPKRFRKELGTSRQIYLYLAENGEIWGFDDSNWQKLAGTILALPLSTEEGRLKRIRFFSKAAECELDSQGRFILPQEFVETAGLYKDVLIIGAGDHFEIWNPKSWETQR